MTVAELTERELVGRVQRRLPSPPPWLLVGIGDDAAVVEPERNRVEVLTVDALVEDVHFDRAFVPPDAIGHRALAVNLSDLAAMGASPRLALFSAALPESLPVADFEALVDGLASLAERHRVHVIGGNLTRSPGPLVVDVTAVGSVKRRQALTRAGARPGDDVYVSGTLGRAAAGLARLREEAGGRQVASRKSQVASRESQVASRESQVASRESQVASQESQATSPEAQLEPSDLRLESRDLRLESRDLRLEPHDLRLETCDLRLISAYLRPEPRVRLGLMLSRNRAASACIDLSDGLGDGVHRIAEASGVGVAIDADAVPVDADARAWFGARGQDAFDEAIAAGDDYELLFTVGPRARRRLSEAARHGGVRLTRIGQCTADRAVVVRRGSGLSPMRGGYSHFA